MRQTLISAGSGFTVPGNSEQSQSGLIDNFSTPSTCHMKHLLFVLLLVLAVGCQEQPKLTVSLIPTNEALALLGDQGFHGFDIDYKGTCNTAGLYVRVFKQGKPTCSYRQLGGLGEFLSPQSDLSVKMYVGIFDSRSPLMALRTPENIAGDFYRFRSYTRFAGSEQRGDLVIPTDEIDFSGDDRVTGWGKIENPDLSKEFIPIGYIRTAAGRGLSLSDQVPGEDSKLDDGCDYVVFYLRLITPAEKASTKSPR